MLVLVGDHHTTDCTFRTLELLYGSPGKCLFQRVSYPKMYSTQSWDEYYNRNSTMCSHFFSKLIAVTNITLYCVWFGYSLRLAAGAFRLLHPGGDSSYPWVSVRALGHNLGKDRTFTLYRLGLVNSKSFVGQFFFRIKWIFELNILF